MKAHSSVATLLGICVASAALSACGGTQGTNGASGALPPNSARIARHAFNGPQARAQHTPRFLHEFLLPKGAYPGSITTGSDGALWFGDYPYYTNHPPTHLGIGRITTSGEQQYFLFENGVYDVAQGGDGRIWFTNAYAYPYTVGALTTQGTFTQYSVPSAGTPESIAADASGHLWYTAFGGTPDVVEIDTSGTTVATYNVKHGYAVKVAYGKTGAIWFDAIGNPSTVGRISERGKASGKPIGGPNYIPGRMVLGPDGRMWICDGSMLAAVTRTFAVTRYPLPQSGNCAGITAGSDGNLWATDFINSAIVRSSTDGKMIEYRTPTVLMFPSAIAAGPDGNIWFTEIQRQTDVSKIGVLQP